MNTFFRYFGFATFVSLVCLVVAAWDGYTRGGHTAAALASALTIALLLGVLELSLSFDNAVVNASVLRKMDPVWKRRFLTIGILIAVFGMRFLFPILIVSMTAGVGFGDVVKEAMDDPEKYRRHLEGAHTSISAFGGAFLLMVFLKYFMDGDKEQHWLAPIEGALAKIGKLDTIQAVIALSIIGILSHAVVPKAHQFEAITAGTIGVIVYLIMDSIGSFFEKRQEEQEETEQASGSNIGQVAQKATAAGFASFLYLEVLDASFSLDGVIGAFALTQDIILIAAGLTIGAIFVRSLTVMMVEKGTLEAYRYLEHGAHWGIGALAAIMLASLSPEIKIPEVVTGLIGAGFIVLSVITSLGANKKEASS